MISPDEEFAMTRGEHGHPEVEGYGRTTLEGDAPATDDTGPAPPTTVV